MNEYEITYLIDPQLDENAREELNSSIEKHATDLNGAVKHTSPALRRKLAYEIDEKLSAFARDINIELEPEKVPELEAFLKKADGVMRFMLIKTPERAAVAPEIIERHMKRKGKKDAKQPKKKEEASKKKVSMKDVEKGIEEALTEEVK